MAVNVPGAYYFVNADHLGAPRSVTDAAGTLRWTWDHDAFGTTQPSQNPASVGTFSFNLRFPGQYYDAETGLSYNNARDYNRAWGRYVQSDPIGLGGAEIGAINTYDYARGNPLGRIDPEGKNSLPAIYHYLFGGGGKASIDFSDLNADSIRPLDFPKVKSLLSSGAQCPCTPKTIFIDDKKPYSLDDHFSLRTLDMTITTGSNSLRLQGNLTVNSDCSWTFYGLLRSYDDTYDFNKSSHRNWFYEIMATFGRLLPGEPYNIHITGGRVVSESGKL